MFKKWVAALTLAATVVMSMNPLVSAATPERGMIASQQVQQQQVAQLVTVSQPGSVEEDGLRSYLVKQALGLIADSIRYGGDALAYILRYIDDDAASALTRYADEIADELDYIATIPDVVESVVKEKLYYFLVNELGLSGGTALQIADAVVGAIGFLLL